MLSMWLDPESSQRIANEMINAVEGTSASPTAVAVCFWYVLPLGADVVKPGVISSRLPQRSSTNPSVLETESRHLILNLGDVTLHSFGVSFPFGSVVRT